MASPSPARDATAVSVDAATSLAEAGRLMTALDLSCVLVLRNGANAGTLAYRDVARGLRWAGGDRSVAAAMRDANGAAPDPPPPAEAAADPPAIENHAAVFEPDLLLGSQYLDRVRRSAEFEPERRLMVAVLEQGVRDYVKGPRDSLEADICREAEAWVEDRDANWVYSFQRICDMLGIDADYLRRGLHAARERARGPKREEKREVAVELVEQRARRTSG